ncbi:MAG: DUF6717 family protein [Bacteroidota bacterium]
MEQVFRFYKTAAHKWFVDLPDWGGNIDDLEMVEGADEMLDIISGYSEECHLRMSDERFDEAEVLVLDRPKLEEFGGGGIYVLECYKDNQLNHELWLCGVTQTVFKDLPKHIYFKKASG